ncbi:thiamine diphosphokinase [Bacillus sp. FJAT-50079]|uniref:thiamine diphosphokinase n=1 Tax=Bacillus sp. FJAT-50079 TaxID=2833577 RepID=UPI001BC9E1A8|nr:thiamine diphosphokinase [Bacillus sp. FJAT-50079]MBS4207666.1 thiamine diphosphokinase [Bacillus sp. FJAT-50079]
METNNKAIHIMAGGPRHLIPDVFQGNDQDILWIGVDRGVIYLLDAGIRPDFAVGDFDSISAEEWEKVRSHIQAVNRFKPEKDETDMELAIEWALKHNPDSIKIFGGTGGRSDHFFANAFMLAPYQLKQQTVTFELIDIQNTISIFYPGEYDIEIDNTKKYISFLPLSSEIFGLSLKGFKYPLKDKYVPFGSSLCISNELLQQTGTFSFEKGILMMVRSTD